MNISIEFDCSLSSGERISIATTARVSIDGAFYNVDDITITGFYEDGLEFDCYHRFGVEDITTIEDLCLQRLIESFNNPNEIRQESAA